MKRKDDFKRATKELLAKRVATSVATPPVAAPTVFGTFAFCPAKMWGHSIFVGGRNFEKSGGIRVRIFGEIRLPICAARWLDAVERPSEAASKGQAFKLVKVAVMWGHSGHSIFVGGRNFEKSGRIRVRISGETRLPICTASWLKAVEHPSGAASKGQTFKLVKVAKMTRLSREQLFTPR
jgi:hypothetical protein